MKKTIPFAVAVVALVATTHSSRADVPYRPLEFPSIGLPLDIEALFPNQDQGFYEGVCTVDAVYTPNGRRLWESR